MGKFYGIGSIIEDPTAIKRFKSKVNEGKVIVVSDDNLQTVAAYIKARSNVDILPKFAKTVPIDDKILDKSKLDKSKLDEPKLDEPKLDEPKHVAKAKVVIKKK
jgi:hypothetical protein